MQINVGNLKVEVLKKDIKNLHLSVLPPDGKVRVSAPKSMPVDSIEMFVTANLNWIKQKQKEFEEQNRQSKRQFVSGETLYVWGKPYLLQVKYASKSNSLELNGNKAILTVREPSTVKQRKNFVNEWYRKQLIEKVDKLLPKWQQITGIECISWQSKYMITKWGTCNPEKKKIWINLQLAKKPEECLEYIILHELAHMVEIKHNADFILILDKYMPYWREIKQKLNGSLLDYMEE